MKKRLCLILIFVGILAGLCSCASLNKPPVTLADSMAIPENGIIEASVLEALKADNKAVTFRGQSGGIRYEWIVFGRDIQEAKAINLGIEVLESNRERLSFRFCSEENFGFTPVLSLYLTDIWPAQRAWLYEVTPSGTREPQLVTITEERQSICTVSPDAQTGTFLMLPHREEEAPSEEESGQSNASGPTDSDSRPISDGQDQTRDPYKTDPVPEGKPLPVEPDEKEVDVRKTYTCTFSIECASIFNHLKELEPEKLDILPTNGTLFATQTVTFYEGESVYDVLQRVCRENGIHMEASFTPMYNSAYVEGIGNLYEFDCGSGSGWMYRVDGWYPNYGCSRYMLQPGEVVEWRYTCDQGMDIGGNDILSN